MTSGRKNRLNVLKKYFAEMGKQKYGHYLETDNGRNALQDAYEEALDMCMYLKQKLLEEEGK